MKGKVVQVEFRRVDRSQMYSSSWVEKKKKKEFVFLFSVTKAILGF